MKNVCKPIHSTLQKFVKLLHELDPMSLVELRSPDEYASEALSVLSRFHETALFTCEDDVLQKEIAVQIVAATFQFWFNEPVKQRLEPTALALLKAYKSSYPKREQNSASEVQSVP